ncbi:putative Alpha/beta hydrolase [Nitrospira japonica]|uniref:Putative Alpha/beta hydrolase n=1 Tax=Nitrospira japonica TaxID=1325564 RepID=A0A1W1I6N0_9BACT|nr:alpha/beta hydrolase [Nitrospira japonica]SLM48667.1 putative Alpha/beta hydrolase [Nitrospira japonica]
MTQRPLLLLALPLFLIGCQSTGQSDRGSAKLAVASDHTAAKTAGEVRRRPVPAGGVTLSILEGGTGKPVIFVHGVVTTSNIFPTYLQAYSPAYRGIAVDLRGYGDSEKPSTGFTIKQFSEDLIALANKLSIEKPVWVGVSMGGMILQQLALDHPERVGALVLVSTTDGAMVLDKDLPTIGRQRDYRDVSHNIIVESFPPGTPPALYQPLLDRIPTWNGTVLREALTSMAQANVHGRLHAISAPTLIVVGEKDDVATPAIARGIQSQIAGSKLVEFQTGHFMMAEDPERFRTVLGDFLRSLK